MKMTMDLLPVQYKCVPRDWKAIFIMILLIIAIPGLWFGLTKYYKYSIDKIQQISEDEMKQMEENVNRVSNEIADLENQLKTARISKDKIKEINTRISFFNEIYQREISYYEFFDKLEKLTPQDVYIKDIKPVGENAFEIECEAKESFHAPDFLKNMMQNKEFSPPTKDKNAIELVEVNQDDQSKAHRFKLTFKFCPFKQMMIDPSDKLVMHVGDDKEIRVFIINIENQKKELSPGMYIAEVVNLDGSASLNEKTGKLKALTEGKGFVKISTGDKKYTATLNFDIQK